MSDNLKLDQFLKKNQFSGTVLVKKEGETIFSGAYGYADIMEQRLNDLHTKFRIASLNKLFTAISIVQLVEQGRLFFSTKIDEYLETRYIGITVYELLTHTSGLTDYYDHIEENGWEEFCRRINLSQLRELRDYTQVINDNTKRRDDHNYSYSCAGYILLGLLIEKITGITFKQYVQENILSKLNMQNTVFYEIEDLVENVAQGYYISNGVIKKNICKILPSSTSNGGALSTVEDMVILFQELLSNSCCIVKNNEVLLKPYVKQNLITHGYDLMYGYGIEYLVNSEEEVIRMGVAGEEVGASCRLYHYPKEKLTFSIMSNYSLASSNIGWYIHEQIYSPCSNK
jgi:CubicO group peptidase (beta-lactamase class C family)